MSAGPPTRYTPAAHGPVWQTQTGRRRTVSWWWWLLPILMGWLGGLIAWIVNRDADPAKARQMLLVGIVLSVAQFVFVLPLVTSGSGSFTP